MNLPEILNGLIPPPMNWQQAFLDAAAIGDDRPTWAYDWPAGLRLAHNLGELYQLQGKKVCDLGCGRGTLGLCALQLGAAHVDFCDGSAQVLSYVQKVLDCNHFLDTAQCHVHQWGKPLPLKSYDIILGGDILYRPE